MFGKFFLQKFLKNRTVTTDEVIEGSKMTSSQKERMLMVHSHLDFVLQSISSDKKKSAKITRTKACLELALMQCTKSTTTPYFKKCEHLTRRKDKKRDIIAIVMVFLNLLYLPITMPA